MDRVATFLTALAGATTLTQPAFANDIITIGTSSYIEEWFGYSPRDGRGPPINPGVVAGEKLWFVPQITTDNGLTFGEVVRGRGTPPPPGTSALPDTALVVSGDFGTVVIDNNGDGFNPVPAGPPGFSACGSAPPVRYISPRIIGFSSRLGYQSEAADGRHRGALATESAGTVVNPALQFDYRLTGPTLGLGAVFCVDTGDVLPATLGVSINGSRLDGSASAGGLSFPSGLGVTGVGGIPGVFVGPPTDLTDATFDVERNRIGVDVNLTRPLFFDLTGAPPGGGASGPGGFAPPSFNVISAVGGVRAGRVDQTEHSRFRADTPAFGAGSGWRAAYDTDFDGSYVGLYGGVSGEHSQPTRNGGTITYKLTGTVGYDHYNFSVHDRVSARGLGGALDYSNSNRIEYRDGLFTAGLTGSVSVTRGNATFSGYVGVEHGRTPILEYARPDSTVAGALDPTLALKANTTFNAGAFLSLNF